ncbi:MAG: Cna B-type domain-containing protein [Collinsella sp.]|nr:Cna B-type domain-containing protein [Collinsella sp.]
MTVRLLADGEDTGKTLTLNAGNNWTGSFGNLVTHKDGTAVAYTVSEDAVPAYTTSITGSAGAGFTIANDHTPEQVSVDVSNAWVDNDNAKGIRPASVTAQLQANGKDVAGKTVTLGADGSWSATFAGLPKYENGTEIAYTVTEPSIASYSTVRTGTAGTGFVFTSTIVGKVSVGVTKVWEGIVPAAAPEVSVNLLADGRVVATQALSAANGWKHTFADLDQYASGKEIAYTVEEKGAADGTLTAGGHEYGVQVSRAADGGFTVKNTMVNPKLTATGTVSWDDAENQDGIRPEKVTVTLTHNGEPTDTTVEVDTAGDGSFSFEGLPTFDDRGEKIAYGVIQNAVDEYDTAVTGDLDEGLSITNAHAVRTRDITVENAWDDAENQDGIRPDKVVVRLLANGEDTGKTVELSEENGWKAVFEGVDVNASGEEIAYTVEVEQADGYESTVSGSMEDGFSVTSAHEVDKRDVSVSVTWDDADDQDGIRPEKVVVRLLANGEDTGKTVELSAANGWKAVFEALDVNKEGAEIAYTVSQDGVDGYETSYAGSMADGLTVVNTHTPKPSPAEAGKGGVSGKAGKAGRRRQLPRTGDTQGVALVALVGAIGAIALAGGVRRRRQNG